MNIVLTIRLILGTTFSKWELIFLCCLRTETSKPHIPSRYQTVIICFFTQHFSFLLCQIVADLTEKKKEKCKSLQFIATPYKSVFMKDCSEVTLCKLVPAKSLECVESNVLPPNLVLLTNTVAQQKKTPKTY